MKADATLSYQRIISAENLHAAWREFSAGKKDKPDVAEFALELSRHIYELHFALKHREYRHAGYHAFPVNDPKPRSIHKAVVRDRVLHRALHRELYPFFDRLFIYDSYSCRTDKGTHRALYRFADFSRKVSRSNKRTCFALKCDVRKCFASVNHETLHAILKKWITDAGILWLLQQVIWSFNSGEEGKGLPLGNLTSQLLVNVYMNEFDQFVKHKLKMKYYIRYADDFVMLSHERTELECVLPLITIFLRERLRLSLHPDKVFIKTVASGVDFLGWVHFPDHNILRTSTKRRMLRQVNKYNLSSYIGLCKHGNAFKLQAAASHTEHCGGRAAMLEWCYVNDYAVKTKNYARERRRDTADCGVSAASGARDSGILSYRQGRAGFG